MLDRQAHLGSDFKSVGLTCQMSNVGLSIIMLCLQRALTRTIVMSDSACQLSVVSSAAQARDRLTTWDWTCSYLLIHGAPGEFNFRGDAWLWYLVVSVVESVSVCHCVCRA
ncbi:unnamed protein product [Symbiodinium natans]|uniref:Uncharacterized protein n=1 Tax=Symbiodinium natans TaxID=878477 RepID=A0A812S662_9DINO|nr:unnamed protein product [Symbiodinium natans]